MWSESDENHKMSALGASFRALRCSSIYAENTFSTSRSFRGAEEVLSSGLCLGYLSTDKVSFMKGIFEAQKESLETMSGEKDAQTISPGRGINRKTTEGMTIGDASNNQVQVEEDQHALKANIVSQIHPVLTLVFQVDCEEGGQPNRIS